LARKRNVTTAWALAWVPDAVRLRAGVCYGLNEIGSQMVSGVTTSSTSQTSSVPRRYTRLLSAA
jgi:hypothetical protein